MRTSCWIKSLGLMMTVIIGCTSQLGKQTQKGPPLPQAVATVDSAIATKIQASYLQLPLQFEANHGQSNPQVKFLSRGNGYALFLTPTEAVLSLFRGGNGETAKGGNGEDRTFQPAVLRMHLAGANPQPQVEGVEELPGKSNYFSGNDPARWHTNIPTYAKVKYQDVYPGVDLVYYGNQRQLEYDFVVAPGVDPTTIKLSFQDQGGQSVPVHVGVGGDLVVRVADSEVHLRKPLIYQEMNGAKHEISGHYVVLEPADAGRRAVGFQVASYDTTKPLIIDPVLEYATYFGGTGRDTSYGIAVHDNRYAYIAGTTFSDQTTFPLKNAYDGTTNSTDNGQIAFTYFVAKLDTTASGAASLVFSTYLGANTALDVKTGAYPTAHFLAVDPSGNVYLTGVAGANHPVTPGSAFQSSLACPTGCGSPRDAFVTKFSADGATLLYSTYLGGTSYDEGRDIAVDSTGNAYVTGYTESTNFPLANAFQSVCDTIAPGCRDAFITKINTNASGANSLLYSTYLGGSGGDDIGLAIAADDNGNAYVTGVAREVNFPTKNAFQSACDTSLTQCLDAFVAKLDTSLSGAASLLYSSYLGGNHTDMGYGIAVDAAGNVYVTGAAISNNFPTKNALFPTKAGGTYEAFVAKVNPAASGAASLVFSTYLGGSANDFGRGIAVDATGNVCVAGATNSTNFPVVNPSQPAIANSGEGLFSNHDAFAAKLKNDGSVLLFSTYLGGNSNDEAWDLAVDGNKHLYVTGETSSSLFPTVNAYQGSFTPTSGNVDAFVAKISAPVDADSDAFLDTQDCDDNNPAVHPNAAEVCDSVDNDCDGQVDEGLLTTFYQDHDGDGYGTSTTSQQACSQPTGYVTNNTDCNDNDAAVHPGAGEVCNGRDDNCNNATDESPTSVTAPLTQSCYGGPAGTAGVGLCHSGTQTCNNGTFDSCAGEVTPTTETCNSQDDDCDGSTDEGMQTTFYQDADGDGYGNLAVTNQACTAPSGYVANSTDCNDANNASHPGVSEACDAQDNNCNGSVDESFNMGNACSAGVGACQQTGVTVCAANGSETVCNAVAGTPTAELCGDAIDQDCDGIVDNGFDIAAACTVGIGACQRSGAKVCTGDGTSTQCNVTAGSPTAEICGDGIDNDCNGVVDNGCSLGYQTGGLCLGAPGHQILQPINVDGTSIFKQGATVVAKFRICDANGTSVGHPGAVTDFRLVQVVQGTATQTVNEAVVSNTPDTAFRWDASAQQWIFNISTKSLAANQTYFYRISLDDGSFIDFQFGLKK